MPRLFKVNLEMIFDDEKSKAMSKEDLSDIIWKNVHAIGNGFQMLNVRSVSETPSKLAQKQIMEICEEACERQAKQEVVMKVKVEPPVAEKPIETKPAAVKKVAKEKVAKAKKVKK